MRFIKVDITKPCSMVAAGHFVSNGPWKHPRRTLDNTEIILCTEGIIHIDHGKERSDIKVNESVVLLENEEHAGYSISNEPVSFYWFHFRGDIEVITRKEAIRELYLMQSNLQAQSTGFAIIPILGEWHNLHRLTVGFNQMMHISGEKYYTSLAKDYAITSLLLEMSQLTYARCIMENTDEHPNRRLLNIMEWIKSHADSPIGYGEVAEAFKYNKHYINKYFKEQTGMTINAYIHVQRIEKAKDMLYRGHRTIKEIAYEVGYLDEKYFYKVFKKHVGMTPTQYQNVNVHQDMNTK